MAARMEKHAYARELKRTGTLIAKQGNCRRYALPDGRYLDICLRGKAIVDYAVRNWKSDAWLVESGE